MEVDFQGYIILFLVWLVSTVLVRIMLTKFRTKPRLPPSPMALPILGHLHLLAPIPHQALHKLSNRYGSLIHLFLGSVPCVVASTPEMAKEFLKTHEGSFSNRPYISAVDYLTYGSADFSFAPYGPYWKFMKKLCMSELLGGRTLDQLLPVRREELASFVQLLLNKAKAAEPVDVGAELMTVTNNVISRMIMGQSCSSNEKEADEIRKQVKAIAELTGKFNLSDFIWFCKNLDLQGFGKQLKEVRDRFDVMMERIIKEHQEERKKKEVGEGGGDAVKDLLDILLDIAEDETSEFRLTRENIKAFILSSEFCTIGGYDIPAKTRLFVNVWAINRDPNHWEKPLEFEPERFVTEEGSGKSQLDVRGQHFHLLPFGSGRRGCPGTSLAMQVVQTTLAAMVQCFEWKVEGTVDMEEAAGLTLPRAHPLVCVPVARFNPVPSS
ncbi:hypothetical protein C1H46_025631 [Malus baccata]|uniref:Cytochrome P450 n=1 Tax=Malus baccata TaxID=106549 RepID=A0A540LQP3_MALBA|nr:hypothetical protein C1H46_025631 [Malus baccata]